MTTNPVARNQPTSLSDTGLDAVTGAFSYSGKAISSALINSGRLVRTLTGHPNRAVERSPIEIRPLDFEDQIGLVGSLEGVTTLYNTYWVRFAHNRIDHDLAVENSRTLFQAAKRAGSSASCTSASRTQVSIRRFPTFEVRLSSNAHSPRPQCRTPCCGPPFSLVATECY